MGTKITKVSMLILIGIIIITSLGSCSVICEHSELTEVSNSATCVETGIKKFKCNRCGKVFEEKSPKKEHEYKNGVCIQCKNTWKESFNDEIGTLLGVSFSLDSATDGIKWSHTETYVSAQGVILPKSHNDNIGEMTISAGTFSCTYEVILSVTSDKCIVGLKQISGDEVIMELMFSNFASAKAKCCILLGNAINELRNQLKSKFDLEIS